MVEEKTPLHLLDVTSGATIDQGAGSDSVCFGSSLTGTTLTGNGADTFSMASTTVVFGALATAATQVSFGSNADMVTFSAAVGEASIYGGAELDSSSFSAAADGATIDLGGDIDSVL